MKAHIGVDAGYRGAEKRKELNTDTLQWHIAEPKWNIPLESSNASLDLSKPVIGDFGKMMANMVRLDQMIRLQG